MIRIVIKSLDVEQRTQRSKDGSKTYNFRTQHGWVELGGETRKVPIALGEGDMANEVGTYTLGDDSFYIGDFGRLMIGRIHLQRLPERVALPGGAAKAV